MGEDTLTRRRLTAGLGLCGLAACAPVLRAKGPPVMVNVAGPALQPTEDGGVRILSGDDGVRRMTVPVFLNTRGPHDFVVDTGANHSVVGAELAAQLELPDAGKAPIHGIAGVEPASTVIVNRLAVGDLVSRRVKAPILPQARLGASGLLGVDVLKDRRVTMDFKNNQFHVAASSDKIPEVRWGARSSRLAGRTNPVPTDPAPVGNLVTVPARYRFGQLIIIDADVGGHPVVAFLDSGSQNTVANLALQKIILSDPGFQAQSLVVQMVSATGQTASGELSPIPALRLGGLRIGRVSAVFADLHVFDIWDLKREPALLIGIDIMRHFESIELDFGKRRVTFRLPTSANQILAGP